MAQDHAGDKAAIDRFLADNPELEQLSARLATFNAFRALKIENAEIRHSNVLAWLLDPAESHALDDIVLRRVLSNMLLETDTDIEVVSAAEIELMDFADVEVRREWRNIDILVVSRRNKLVVLIENKIGSKESRGQLLRYRDIVSKEFPSFRIIPVFLTLFGEDTADELAGYVCYSHEQLLGVLDRVLDQRASRIPEAVGLFLRQYAGTLRRLTMQDEELVALCKAIYSRHKDAIDLIVEYGVTGAALRAAENVIAGADTFEILCTRSKQVWFIPKTWAKILPENGTAWNHIARPVSVACWLLLHKARPRIIFEVCKMTDPDLRLRCVKKLSEAGFKLTKKAFDEDATYSRFFRATQPVSDISDAEEVRKATEKLLARAEHEFAKAEAVFREVFAQ